MVILHHASALFIRSLLKGCCLHIYCWALGKNTVTTYINVIGFTCHQDVLTLEYHIQALWILDTSYGWGVGGRGQKLLNQLKANQSKPINVMVIAVI